MAPAVQAVTGPASAAKAAEAPVKPAPRVVEKPAAEKSAPKAVPEKMAAKAAPEKPAAKSADRATGEKQAVRPATDKSSAKPAAAAKPAAPARPAKPREKLLVAESDADSARKLCELLDRWGIDGEVVASGGEALLWIHRNKPSAALIGGHLAGLGGPALTEIVRRTAELREMKLIRIAPLDEPAGAPEFEADSTFEPGSLAAGLEAALGKLKLGERPEPAAPQPPPRKTPARGSSAQSDPRVLAAERLARIIVSDIILYNQDKFQRAVAEGTISTALEAELTEASGLFRQRVPEEVRVNRDFLMEELERRAKSH